MTDLSGSQIDDSLNRLEKTSLARSFEALLGGRRVRLVRGSVVSGSRIDDFKLHR